MILMRIFLSLLIHHCLVISSIPKCSLYVLSPPSTYPHTNCLSKGPYNFLLSPGFCCPVPQLICISHLENFLVLMTSFLALKIFLDSLNFKIFDDKCPSYFRVGGWLSRVGFLGCFRLLCPSSLLQVYCLPCKSSFLFE